MTVSSEVNKSGPYNGNGVTVVFGYGFKIVDEDHLTVIKTVGGVETVLTIGTNYTVSGVGNPAGGTITATVAPATGQTITIIRNVPFLQETDLENQGAYYAETIEAALDLAAMRDQELQEQISRAVKIPASSDPSALPSLIEDVIRLADSAANIDIVATSIASVNEVASNMDDIVLVAGAVEEIQAIAVEVIAAAGSAAASAAEAAQQVANVIPSVIRFSGDGVDTTFDLGTGEINENMTNVYIDGVYQQKDTYSVVVGVLTFSSAPPAGTNNIEVMIAGNVAMAVAIPTDGSVTNVKVAAGAGIDASKLSFTPPSGIARTIVSVLNDWSHSVLGYGAVIDGNIGTGTGTDNSAAINSALSNNNGHAFIPPGGSGSLMLDAGITLPPNGSLEAFGWGKTRLTRRGVWADHTVEVGSDVASANNFKIEGILFEQLHIGFVQGTSVTMADRLTGDQAHIKIWGGTNGSVRNCWFQGAVRSLDILGTTNLVVERNIFQGSYDTLNSAVSETLAYARLRSTVNQGICTMPQFRGNYLGGGPLVSRSYTVGSVTYSAQGNGGAYTALDINSVEGLQVSGGYIGGQNFASVRVNPDNVCTNLNFFDFYCDGAELTSFLFTQSAAGQQANNVNIHNIGFNGQFVTPNLLFADNPNAEAVVFGLNFTGNTGQGHNNAPLILKGLRAGNIKNNTIASYNARGGWGIGTPDGCAGAFVTGNSSQIHFDGNIWGGAANNWSATNNCGYGDYFTGAFGTVGSSERAILGLGGGGLVGGLTGFTPTAYQ